MSARVCVCVYRMGVRDNIRKNGMLYVCMCVC